MSIDKQKDWEERVEHFTTVALEVYLAEFIRKGSGGHLDQLLSSMVPDAINIGGKFADQITAFVEVRGKLNAARGIVYGELGGLPADLHLPAEDSVGNAAFHALVEESANESHKIGDMTASVDPGVVVIRPTTVKKSELDKLVAKDLASAKRK